MKHIILWIPAAFSAVLSFGVVGPVFSGYRISESPGLIAFYCFLPMAFFFVGTTVSSYVARLEKRVAALESRIPGPREDEAK